MRFKQLSLIVLALLFLPTAVPAQINPDAAAQNIAERDEALRPDYKRSDWGRWLSTGERGLNGCRFDTRHSQLRDAGIRSPKTFVMSDEKGKSCRVRSITITDAYTGIPYTGSARKVDVEEVVPMAEAHRSGGWKWTADEKQAFHNDPLNHVLVHESVNSSKSDRDPGGQRFGKKNGVQVIIQGKPWLPPDREAKCRFGVTWLTVKAKYRLAMDAAEVGGIVKAVAACSEGAGEEERLWLLGFQLGQTLSSQGFELESFADGLVESLKQ